MFAGDGDFYHLPLCGRTVPFSASCTDSLSSYNKYQNKAHVTVPSADPIKSPRLRIVPSTAESDQTTVKLTVPQILENIC